MKNKLISIIAEEYQGLQEHSYQDDDVIDPTQVNLRDEYNRINTELFNDELPEVKMRWSTRKGNLGHVVATINRVTNEAVIKNLAISSFHAMPYRVFKDTLAHEMIHIKQISDNEFNSRESHGMEFHGEMRRINNMGLGYNIMVRSEDKLDMSNIALQKAAGKTFICIILEIDGRKMLNVTTQRVYDAEGQNVFDLFQKLVNRGKYREVTIIVVKSDNPQLLKYTISRTFRRGLSYAPLSDELLDELLQGEEIKSETIRSNMSESENVNAASNWEDVTIV